jgi:hypothetical protein
MRKQPKLHLNRETLRSLIPLLPLLPLEDRRLAPAGGYALPTAFASCVIACPNRPFSQRCA